MSTFFKKITSIKVSKKNFITFIIPLLYIRWSEPGLKCNYMKLFMSRSYPWSLKFHTNCCFIQLVHQTLTNTYIHCLVELHLVEFFRRSKLITFINTLAENLLAAVWFQFLQPYFLRPRANSETTIAVGFLGFVREKTPVCFVWLVLYSFWLQDFRLVENLIFISKNRKGRFDAFECWKRLIQFIFERHFERFTVCERLFIWNQRWNYRFMMEMVEICCFLTAKRFVF